MTLYANNHRPLAVAGEVAAITTFADLRAARITMAGEAEMIRL